MSNFEPYPPDLSNSMIRTVNGTAVPVGHTIVAVISDDVDKGVYDWENHGTAVCIDGQGHFFVTAAHVVDNIKKDYPDKGLCILKFLQDIQQVLAVPIYRVILHETVDLAICCAAEVVFADGESLTNPRFILNSAIAADDEDVFALGYPRRAHDKKYNFYYSDGHVRTYNEFIDKVMNPYPCYELELISDGGMSGCPILNKRCEIIAILSNGIQDITYAVPISYIVDFLTRRSVTVYREDVLAGKIPTVSIPVIRK